LHRKTLPHSLMLHAKEEEKDQQFEEEKRLFYVAVTRARKMLVLGEGFSAKQGGLWRRWASALFENIREHAIDRAREGKTSRVRFRSRGQEFSAEILSAGAFARSEQLALNIDIAAVNRDALYQEFKSLLQKYHAPATKRAERIELTPSDLGTLRGCFRYFHWTRALGRTEPGSGYAESEQAMRRGSVVHELLERTSQPSSAILAEKGLSDLDAVFQSNEWKTLSKMDVERELPFMMHVDVAGRDCFIRGRMDAVTLGEPPRVIDYKYALWREGAELAYELQMATYCLATMNNMNVDSAVGELWFLKSPMRIVRREFTRSDAEKAVRELLERFFESLTSDEWPMAERAHCDAVFCGFRERCWSK
jgi:ATP-dependent exoDNAse (exonuclease V) beta subunit